MADPRDPYQRSGPIFHRFAAGRSRQVRNRTSRAERILDARATLAGGDASEHPNERRHADLARANVLRRVSFGGDIRCGGASNSRAAAYVAGRRMRPTTAAGRDCGSVVAHDVELWLSRECRFVAGGSEFFDAPCSLACVCRYPGQRRDVTAHPSSRRRSVVLWITLARRSDASSFDPVRCGRFSAISRRCLSYARVTAHLRPLALMLGVFGLAAASARRRSRADESVGAGMLVRRVHIGERPWRG